MLAKVVGQTSWSMLGSVFGFAIGFFVKMFLIRTVGTEAFGTYMIGQTVVSTVQVLVAFALPRVLLRFLPAMLEKKEKHKVDTFASFTVQYLIIVGALAAAVIAVFHNEIASIFHESDNYLAYIIMLSALYLPLILYMGALSAMYRSLLKIKEIVLYGTIWMVSIRAILTFVVFSFTDDIAYFILIELFSTTVVVFVMTKKFDTSRISFTIPFPYKEVLKEHKVVHFAKKMYFYTLVGFAGGYAITMVMSIILPASDVGVYAILVTIAGLSAFLLNNLNAVFAPLISKLHASGDHHKLEALFKDSTFIINILTTPFIVLLVLFSHDVLALYGDEVSHYAVPLVVLVLGSYVNLFVGNSGMLLLMGGRENDEIYIKVANIVLVLLLSIAFIPQYGFMAAVGINALSMIAVNMVHVFFVKKRFGFTPWGMASAVLFLMTVSVIVYVAWYDPSFEYAVVDYVWVSLLVLFVFWVPFTPKILKIIQEIKAQR